MGILVYSFHDPCDKNDAGHQNGKPAFVVYGASNYFDELCIFPFLPFPGYWCFLNFQPLPSLIRGVRGALLGYLTAILGNDGIAAQCILLHLLSRVNFFLFIWLYSSLCITSCWNLESQVCMFSLLLKSLPLIAEEMHTLLLLSSLRWLFCSMWCIYIFITIHQS